MSEQIKGFGEEESARARLYLDLDGVIYPIDRLSDGVDDPDIGKSYNLDWWRKSVTSRIGRMGLEVVLASSWGGTFMGDTYEGPKQDLAADRYLNVLSTSRAEAILLDLNRDPKPFVWIDDRLTREMIAQVKDGLTSPVQGLFVRPYPRRGLTLEELDAIETGFLSQLV